MLNTLEVPALLAESPSPEVSGRYKFVSTQRIADRLESFGWFPREAFFRKTRKGSPLHARHCVRFVHETMLGNNQYRPEIAIFNSHDGRSCLEMMSAIFRMICSNGLTVKETSFEEFKIPHRGYKASDKYIDHAIEELTNQANYSEHFASKWGNLKLNDDAVNKFHRDAMSIRFPDYKPGEQWILEVAKREEDHAKDLWTVFNRSQEHLVNGGFMVTHNLGKKPRMARELSNIDRVNGLNGSLWSLASAYAENYSLN